jgi:hypothetical protein
VNKTYVNYLTFAGFSFRQGTGFVGDRCKNRQIGRQKTMAQRLEPWRSERQQRQWLVCLIATMEQVSRPEIRRRPCDRRVLAAVRAQLARPAFGYPAGSSAFSLRN